MRKNKVFSIFILLSFLVFSSIPVSAQDKKEQKEEKKEVYQFTIDLELPHTPVKNQYRTGTCWCFSTTSYVESELMRMGKGEFDLSEMFTVRHTYPHKADLFIKRHGKANFGQGGQAHDVMNSIKRYGIVPENVYTGMNIGEKRHNHGEMFSVLKGIVDAVVKNRGGRLTPRWKDAFESTLDVYLGKVPESFTYNNKSYTPKTFAEKFLQFNPDNYIELTSYTHLPLYKQCMLQIPDNWDFNKQYYNVPLKDFEKVVDYALKNGYTVVWDGDVSDRNFNTRDKGYAIVPEKDWEDMTKEERKREIKEPVKEKKVTKEMREDTYDNYTTTDDHLMHIVGLAHDQNGTKYYYIKNSGGSVDRKFNGYMYMSEAYFRLRTIAIMVHKDAVPRSLAKKLKIK